MYNAANVARVCRASLAGFALVILSAALAEATHGSKTTIGINYQQWSNTESPNGIDAGNCVNWAYCYLLFSPPPQQKALIIQHVACRAAIGGVNLYYGLLRTRKRASFHGEVHATHACPYHRTLLGCKQPAHASDHVRGTPCLLSAADETERRIIRRPFHFVLGPTGLSRAAFRASSSSPSPSVGKSGVKLPTFAISGLVLP
jgi:hypothetical protein